MSKDDVKQEQLLMPVSSDMRPLTEEEVRDRLLAHVWEIVLSWEKSSQTPSTRGKLEGVAFSILAALDGSSVGLPSFIVAPSPHLDDREFAAKNTIDWWKMNSAKRQSGVYWPENKGVEVEGDVSGGLHEHFHSVGRKLGHIKD